MSSSFYILKGNTPVQATIEEYTQWELEAAAIDRDVHRVALSTVEDADISTVFLRVDHRFCGEGPPILFETMVFGGPLDQDQWRYSTWAEAEAGHEKVVEMVKTAYNDIIDAQPSNRLGE